MKERPILFSTPMVQAILEGRKIMTRRVVKGTALEWLKPDMFTPEFVGNPDNFLCPYGKPGDVLWVRETYYAFGKWEPVEGEFTKSGKQKMWFVDCTAINRLEYYYSDTIEKNINQKGISTKKDGELRWYKRPSIFMPREACRLRLLIKSIRVERLQDIESSNCIAEGYDIRDSRDIGSVPWFKRLWESINGPESWEANPWVWCITFQKLD